MPGSWTRRDFLMAITGASAMPGAARLQAEPSDDAEDDVLVVGVGTSGTRLQHRLQQELPAARFLAIDSPRVEHGSVGRAHRIDVPAAAMREARWMARAGSPFDARLENWLPRSTTRAVVLAGLGGVAGTAFAQATTILLARRGIRTWLFATQPPTSEKGEAAWRARLALRAMAEHPVEVHTEPVRPHGRTIRWHRQPWWDARERITHAVLRALDV